jgi:hypothetical protein
VASVLRRTTTEETNMTPREVQLDLKLRWLASALFFAATVGVVLHIALGGVRHDVLAPPLAIALDVVVGLTWLGAGLVMATRFGPLWILVVVGTWAMGGYGLFEGMQSFWPGAPYLGVAAILLFLMVKTAPLFRPRMETVSGS